MGDRGGRLARSGLARGHINDIGAIARRGWLALVLDVVLAYLVAMVGLVIATNLARGVIELEVALFADGDELPRWLGLLVFVEGFVFLGTALLAAAASLLAGVVETTREHPQRRGRSPLDSLPTRGAPHRAPRTEPRSSTPIGIVLLVLAMVLLVASVITVPLALLAGLFWLASDPTAEARGSDGRSSWPSRSVS